MTEQRERKGLPPACSVCLGGCALLVALVVFAAWRVESRLPPPDTPPVLQDLLHGTPAETQAQLEWAAHTALAYARGEHA
ncbi:MAG: hypothetical protein AB7N76_25215 [Planctomycetota bacterium]